MNDVVTYHRFRCVYVGLWGTPGEFARDYVRREAARVLNVPLVVRKAIESSDYEALAHELPFHYEPYHFGTCFVFSTAYGEFNART